MQQAEKSISARVPEDYVPYGTVNLCTNTLINVRFWFNVSGQIPILVGKGEKGPLLWLRGLIESPEDWRDVIVRNEVLISRVPPFGTVSIVKDDLYKSLSADVGGIPVLRCAELRPNELTVHLIDLSPLHLSIKGNLEGGLYFGSMQMRGNTFEYVETAFAAGSKPTK